MITLTCVVMAILAAPDLIVGELEQIGEGYSFTEGPLWFPGEGLIFTDVPADTIFHEDGTEFRKPSNRANGLFLDNDGRLIACESQLNRLTRTEKDGSITVLADGYEGKGLNSTNDVCVHSDGTIFFTDPGMKRKPAEDELKHNGVYSVNPETKEIRLLSTTARYPNGIGLSPDEKTLYVADTMSKVIRAYDLTADGSLENEREFCEAFTADGMTVDTDGNVWVAVKDGIAVHAPSGERIAHIKTPVMPTNCAFGGSDGKTLYITARKLVFKIRTNAQGKGKF